MGRIKITGMTEHVPLKGNPFDRVLQRQNEVKFVVDVQKRTSISRGEEAFFFLARREARVHPEKMAEILDIVSSYAIVSYSVLSGELTVRFQYRETENINKAAFCMQYCSFCESIDGIPEILRAKTILRNRYIITVVPYDGRDYTQGNVIWDRAFSLHKPGCFNDGTYLERHVSETKVSRYYLFMGLLVLMYELEYRTTYEQELRLYEAVDQAIIKMGLNKPGVSGYEKITAVYRYISHNVVYDDTYQRYTAYHAMIEKCAVCQGYATLFYLFMRKLNVPVEYVSGISEKTNERHGWNIVKQGRYWYNIDTTWEHYRKVRKILISENKYFLKNTEDFKDHIRDEKYMTPEFQKLHPMGKRSV